MSPGALSISHRAHTVKFNARKSNWTLWRFSVVGFGVFSFTMLPHATIGIATHLIPL